MITNANQRVFYFGRTKSEGTKDMKALLGGKGANLAEMTSIGLPVPPGFTVTTECCAEYNRLGERLPSGLMEEVYRNMRMVEEETGKAFGSESDPLLMSVRSGAAVSMPGMMDTVLNLGLNDRSLDGLARASGNRRFALDAYRRLINMFGDVVMGVSHEKFETEFAKVKAKYAVTLDTELDEAGLDDLIKAYKQVYNTHTGEDFPQDPAVQLEKAIEEPGLTTTEAIAKRAGLPVKEVRRVMKESSTLRTSVNDDLTCTRCRKYRAQTGSEFCLDCRLELNKALGEAVDALREQISTTPKTDPSSEMSVDEILQEITAERNRDDFDIFVRFTWGFTSKRLPVP